MSGRLVCASGKPRSGRQTCQRWTQKCQKTPSENTLLLCGTVLSERWKSLFRTVIKPLPRGDKASSAWRSGEDDARRQCYGVSDGAVSLYFVNVNCQNKIKLLFILIVPSAVSWRAIPIMPCRLPSGACRLTPPLSAVIAPVGVFIRINSVNVRAKRLCGYL